MKIKFKNIIRLLFPTAVTIAFILTLSDSTKINPPSPVVSNIKMEQINSVFMAGDELFYYAPWEPGSSRFKNISSVTIFSEPKKVISAPLPESAQMYKQSESENLQAGGEDAQLRTPEAVKQEDSRIPEAQAPPTSKSEIESENPGSEASKESGIPNIQQESTEWLRAEVVRLVNVERVNKGLIPLTADNSDLSAGAMIRAKEASVSFSHTRPDGREWNTASEYVFAENLASGYNTPQEVVAAWMGSPGHEANIMEPSRRTIGVGVYQEDGIRYWSQHFGD